MEDDEEIIEEYEEEEDIEEESKVSKRERPPHRRKHTCPNDCPKFECVIENNCENNCKNLSIAKATICELCRHNERCSPQQKILLLGGKHLDNFKENKVEDIISGALELKKEHEMLEREYRTITDDLAEVPSWNIWNKAKIENKKAKKKMEIIIVRRNLKVLNIKFKENLDFGK